MRSKLRADDGGLKSWVMVILRLAFALFMAVGVTLIFEDSFIYFPTPYPQGDWSAPKRMGVVVEDAEMRTKDGVKIHGWYFPTQDAQTTVLFFHGNAGNLSDRFHWMTKLAEIPAKVLIIDYRGYGKSEGSPSEEGLYLDAEAAWDWLVEEKGTRPEDIVIYGNSLGGGPAAELALRKSPKALVMMSTFTSAKDMAAKMFSILPVRGFVRTNFASVDKVPRIKSPKLFIHGELDDLVPFHMGVKLHEVALEPKTWLPLPRAGHNDITSLHGNRIVDEIREFLGLSL